MTERLYIMPKSSKEAVARLNERAAFIADKVRVVPAVDAVQAFLGWDESPEARSARIYRAARARRTS